MQTEEIVARAILAFRNALAQFVEELNDILQEMAPLEVQQTQQPKAPSINPDELNNAPWRTYSTKELAPPGQDAWIHNPKYFIGKELPQVIDNLADLILSTKDGYYPVGDMEYYLSAQTRFISRRRIKTSQKEDPQ